ncbi:MAG TPA: hypothetical protein VEX35_05630 [Allosphingosinicella sp.]|nr:hypothetical protein [Allosphingosinicella sp.]
MGIPLIAACSAGGDNNASANITGDNLAAATPQNDAASLPPPPPAPADTSVDSAFLIGHWGRQGNCTSTVTFHPDGTITVTGYAAASRWSLNGGLIETTRPDGAATRQPIARSGDALIVTEQSGGSVRLTRCFAPASPPGYASPAPTPQPAALRPAVRVYQLRIAGNVRETFDSESACIVERNRLRELRNEECRNRGLGLISCLISVECMGTTR